MIQKKSWMRPWAFILALLLCVQLVPTGIGGMAGIGPEEVHAGYYPPTWAAYERVTNAAIGVDYTTGVAMESGTITIKTALGLAWLANVVNYVSASAMYKPFGDSVGSSLSGITVTLANDIELSTTSGLKWEPIGYQGGSEPFVASKPFSGNFNGAKYKIININIVTTEDYRANIGTNRYGFGLFGLLDDASVFSLNLEMVSISAINADYVGALAGYAEGSTSISGITVSGITIKGYSDVGGLIGRNNGDTAKISSCASSIPVSASDTKAGGLIGYLYQSTITSSYATGSVTGTGDKVGGLVGGNYSSTVSACYATGNVSGSAGRVGGLVGYSTQSRVTSSYATGNVTGTISDRVGGLIGHNYVGSTVSECYATGIVSGTSDYMGGLVGTNDRSTVSSSHAIGNVSSSGANVGGLVGYNTKATVSACYATGNVTGSMDVGGLVGTYNSSSVSECYATGNVTGNVTGSDAYVGGLIGQSTAYDGMSRIISCYASGSAVSNGNYVGGLLGYSDANLITSSYSVGYVGGTGTAHGGLIGQSVDSSIAGSFWDTATSGLTTSAGLATGKSTADMKLKATFETAGWNFTDTWKMDAGSYGYPIFGWQTSSALVAVQVEEPVSTQPSAPSPSGNLYYSVMFQTNGGSVIYPIRTAMSSAAYRPAAPVKAGYTFGGWYQDAEFTTIYDFDDGISGNTWLFAKWTPATSGTDSGTFTDLSSHSWATEAINSLHDKGVVTGITTNQYGPSLDIIRGDFMLMVFRGFGLTKATNSGDADFQDVPSEKYYAEAIQIAQTQGIAKGVSDTDFAPQGNLTRQDAMTLIYRTLQVKGKLPAAGTLSDLAVFQDQNQVSTYATEAVATLVKAGIIQGNGYGNLAPKANISRAEMAIILQRAMDL